MSEHVLFPSFERAEQYRRLAREAVRRAESSPSPYFRLSYLSLAAGWRALAEHTDQALHEWDEWQREFLHEQIAAPINKPSSDIAFTRQASNGSILPRTAGLLHG